MTPSTPTAKAQATPPLLSSHLRSRPLLGPELSAQTSKPSWPASWPTTSSAMQWSRPKNSSILGPAFVYPRLTSNKVLQTFMLTRQLALGAKKFQNLTINAHLLPYFQAKRSRQVTPGNQMLPYLNNLTVRLTYDDEGYLCNRATMPQEGYISMAVRRMVCAVKSHLNDFISGQKPYKTS